MKIRIRTNLGSADYPGMPWKEGDERDVEGALGASMIERGHAELILPKTVKAVPEKPAVADPKKPDISGGK